MLRTVLAGLVVLSAGCAGPDSLLMTEFEARDSLPQAALPPERPIPAPEVAVAPEPIPRHHSPDGIEIPVAPRLYGEQSREGRSLPYWVVGEGPETVLVFGAIHGDEKSSSTLAYDFLRLVLEDPSLLAGRQLVLAPLVNPDGYARGTRTNARGVDLNRNFPASNWKVLGASRSTSRSGAFARSEPEARFVLYLIDRFDPVRIVSLHGAASCVNWDGPAEELARFMSSRCGLPARASIGYPTPGSFGTYMGIDRRIPTITLELTANHSIQRPIEGYREALLGAVRHPEPLLAK